MVSDRMAHLAGLDDDAVHWIGVAVRESVINAIKHGNREDVDKLVTVEFTFAPPSEPEELIVRVLDQGDGFDPEEIADPLAPENLLKASGRGIFFMRSFMDDVTLRRARRGRDGSAHGQEAVARCLTFPSHCSLPRLSKRSCAPARCSWRISARTSASTRRA